MGSRLRAVQAWLDPRAPPGQDRVMEDALAFARALGLRPAQLGDFLGLGRDDGPLRVVSVGRGVCTLLGPQGLQAARTGEAQPVVGDFVTCDGEGEEASVGVVLPRRSLLQRASAHREGEVQRIAANLDTVFCVAAFAPTDKLQRRALQARRLDRFIAAVRDGDALPVVVLNKRDIAREDAGDLEALVASLSRRLGGVDVVTTSALSTGGVEALSPYLRAGDTVALIGPSGVGKSTLTNAVLGREQQARGAVRDADVKGRHTTSASALHRAPGGALVIDTPGVRQFSPVDLHEPGGFDDVSALAEGCRFGDCGHGGEPGCAVRAAVADGSLPEARLEAYLGLRAEAARDPRPTGRARAEAHAEARRFGRLQREAQRIKRGRR